MYVSCVEVRSFKWPILRNIPSFTSVPKTSYAKPVARRLLRTRVWPSIYGFTRKIEVFSVLSAGRDSILNHTWDAIRLLIIRKRRYRAACVGNCCLTNTKSRIIWGLCTWTWEISSVEFVPRVSKQIITLKDIWESILGVQVEDKLHNTIWSHI